MAYEFKRLGDVPALDDVPEGANALIEVGGDIKRVPGSGLGGGGIPTAILHMTLDTGDGSAVSLADLTGGTVALSAEGGEAQADYTATCDNMTYAEAEAILAAGEPLDARLVINADGLFGDGVELMEVAPAISSGRVAGESNGTEFAFVGFTFASILLGNIANVSTFYWSPDGTISTETPSTSGGSKPNE